MAAPIISSDSDYNTTGAAVVITTADFVLPGGGASVPVAGDRLYFFFSTDAGTATLTPPAGLTAFGAQLNTDGSMNARAWYVDLAEAPEATYSFSHDGGAAPTFVSAVCIKPNGNAFSAQTVGQADTPGATSLATPSLTGGDDERVLIAHWVNDGEVMTVDPSGMTLLRSTETDAFSNNTFAETGVGTGAQTRTATYGASESIAVFAAMVSYTATPAGPSPAAVRRYRRTQLLLPD